MDRRKPLAEMQRPRRRLGEQVRSAVSCPLCLSCRLNVIRWGVSTTRFECDVCGMRWSLDLDLLATALRQPKRPRAFERVGGSMALMVKADTLSGGGAEDIGEQIDQIRAEADRLKPRHKSPRDAGTSGGVTATRSDLDAADAA